ncbi:MAG: hypothetical protein J0I54_12645 [Bosea sp.]|uniref:helix-turn-helix transcriptional regulator n=1 Tax=unclassified Bosea (in: a-proteobacteria) TaxID=2653178 RepID=UPI00095EFF65|nr:MULTISPECIES: hypothetical protein [unclassified Bosea (in: a-proteobacteria)]MBN9457469.1 hypothetical protein [Bosea sp. (in: a-proteobacteria)]OJV09564.1 MAG: hypothetical protein BGO20_02470 [Bosea sp. 67-29]
MTTVTERRDEDPLVDLLSDAQIEKGWPISKATISRQRKAGAFPAPVRVGRLVRTWRSDVNRYFQPKPRTPPEG